MIATYLQRNLWIKLYKSAFYNTNCGLVSVIPYIVL